MIFSILSMSPVCNAYYEKRVLNKNRRLKNSQKVEFSNSSIEISLLLGVLLTKLKFICVSQTSKDYMSKSR